MLGPGEKRRHRCRSEVIKVSTCALCTVWPGRELGGAVYTSDDGRFCALRYSNRRECASGCAFDFLLTRIIELDSCLVAGKARDRAK